jgi:hypothetical protein
MRHITTQGGHALHSVLPRLGRQDLDALRDQDRGFTLNLDAVLQVLNCLDAVNQGLSASGQRLPRKGSASFGRVALPSLRLMNVKGCLCQQLLRFIDPDGVHVFWGMGLVGWGVGGVHKRSNRTLEDGRTQAKVGIVAAPTPIGHGPTSFFSDNPKLNGHFFRRPTQILQPLRCPLISILSTTGNTLGMAFSPLDVIPKNTFIQ